MLRHGNGLPGQFGGDPDVGEAAIRLTGISFHDRLASLGIPHVWEDYGNGVHTWPYWEQGLQRVWPRWLKLAAAHAADPSSFAYRSVDPAWSVYGWDVVFQRAAAEFGSVEVRSPNRFTVTGSGLATVTTPAVFARRAMYNVTTGSASALVRTDNAGRLHLRVDLGPSHSAQEFTPAAQAQETASGAAYFRTAAVTVTPQRG